jgi:hypothetical protein
VNVRVAVERVVAAMEAREDELVAAMLRRNVAEVPDLGIAGDEPEMLDTYRASATANLRAGLTMLSDGVARLLDGAVDPGGVLPSVDVPIDLVLEARASARARVPLEALLRTYRIGHAVTWEALIDEVARVVPESADRQTVLRLLSRFTFAYVDLVLPVVTSEYEAERGRQARRSDQRRLDQVLMILNGTVVDAGDLGYDLRAWHLGLIAWGDGAAAAVQQVAEELARPVLCVRTAEGTAWGWIGGRSRPRRDTWERIRGARLPDGVSVALGTGLRGISGFRRTHRQARDARQVGMALRNRVTRYSDVAVDALALRDPDAARAYVDEMLGALKSAKNSDVLRDTLEAYLGWGLNASSAAKSLGVNDRTVAYRLKVFEELSGLSLIAQRFEVEAAMRLDRVLSQLR